MLAAAEGTSRSAAPAMPGSAAGGARLRRESGGAPQSPLGTPMTLNPPST
jgi:hypothetical protein